VPAFLPPAEALLASCAADLERDVLPALEGYARFRTRVVINVLRLLGRELRLAPGADAAESQRLRALLGDTGEGADLPAMRAALAARIADGGAAPDDPALVDHLRRSLHEALAIDHPGWTGPAG